MEEVIIKLNKVKDIVLKERGDALRLVALIGRTDVDGKWDIVFSADWLKKSNKEEDLVYLIEKLRVEFGDNFEFMARIYTAVPGEKFVQQLIKAIVDKKVQTGLIAENLLVSGFVTIKKLVVIWVNEAGFDFSISEGDGGPLAIREVSEFK